MRSVPRYNLGGTLSTRGATCAIFMASDGLRSVQVTAHCGALLFFSATGNDNRLVVDRIKLGTAIAASLEIRINRHQRLADTIGHLGQAVAPWRSKKPDRYWSAPARPKRRRPAGRIALSVAPNRAHRPGERPRHVRLLGQARRHQENARIGLGDQVLRSSAMTITR